MSAASAAESADEPGTNEQLRLVVGYDGGPSGLDALAFARRWSLSSGGAPTVVTVHPGAASAGAQRVDAEWAAYERQAASEVLDRARALLDDVPGARFVRMDADSAAHALTDLADEGNVVLVLGSPEHGRARRTYLGSTAQRLFFGSASPVVVVPWGYADLGPAPIRQITVAYVATPDGEAALAHGARYAMAVQGSLRVVTVTPDTRVSPAVGEPHRFAAGQSEDFKSVLEQAVSPWRGQVELTTQVHDGPVVEVLTEIDPSGCDLLVCGSRSYGPVRRVLLGGVSHQVVRHARVPVAVVPRSG